MGDRDGQGYADWINVVIQRVIWLSRDTVMIGILNTGTLKETRGPETRIKRVWSPRLKNNEL